MKPQKITYDQMIEMLKKKVHQAPDTWYDIVEDLSLADNVSQLDTHSAPDDLWSKIESDLDEVLPQSENHKYVKIAGLLSSALLIIFLAYNYLYSPEKGNAFVYSSEVEIINDKLPAIESNIEAYDAGLDFIQENELAFTKENFTSYKAQLENLNGAIDKIKTMQEQYGEDASSIKMLSKLEREKAELIKSMINRT